MSDVMNASRFEYRFRYIIHTVIYILGFWSPWLMLLPSRREDTWKVGMDALFRSGWMSFNASASTLLCVAIFFAVTGAFLRVWGTAYVGSSVVQSGSMHGSTMLADGPYRRTRNPLYLGTLLHTFGLVLIMPWSGAIFTVVLIWVFQIRLALAEEPFLTAKFGEAYVAYRNAVPRFIPALTPRVRAAGVVARWGQAALGEVYVIGVAITLAGFGWSFNLSTLIRGVIISFGVSLVVRAFEPKTMAN